jgi:transcription elongation factor S-II
MDARTLAITRLSDIVCDDAIVKGVEKAIYNWTIRQAEEKKVPKFWENNDFVRLYKGKLRSIIFNLKNTSNPELLASVKAKEVTPKQLLAMSPQEMHPKLWEPVLRRLKAREMLKSGNFGEVPEGMLQCGKCKSKRVIWYQLQTRSADEPMTTFCTCSECNKRWKMAG